MHCKQFPCFPWVTILKFHPEEHLCLCLPALSLSRLTLCDPMDCNPQLLCPWDSSGKNTGADCHFLLQRVSHQEPRRRLLCLLHWQMDSLRLGSPRTHTHFFKLRKKKKTIVFFPSKSNVKLATCRYLACALSSATMNNL